jgi:glycosyltransferase involved in cell wall biosynthesis
MTGWRVTLVILHDQSIVSELTSSVKVVCLGGMKDATEVFTNWLDKDPQKYIVTSDVSAIEGLFPYFPPDTRHVVHIHDSMHFHRQVVIRNLEFLDGVICVSRHVEAMVRRDLRGRDFKGVIATIYNGADFPTQKRADEDDHIRLLFMGRMDPLKGISDIPVILKQLRKLKVPCHLTLVGGHSNHLDSIVKKNGLESMVTCKGLVPHQECYQVAAENDIFLMLSRKEPFGMVTIEAMSMGCVPIAYDFDSGSKEIIEHELSGILMPTTTVKRWADVIAGLHANRPMLRSMSYAASVRARGTFSASAASKSFQSFVLQIDERRNKFSPHRRSKLETVQKEAAPHVNRSSYHRLPNYHLLPPRLRAFLRHIICRNPRVGSWLMRHV